MLECDEFFLKFLEPFKQLKASPEAAVWEADGKLKYNVRFGCAFWGGVDMHWAGGIDLYAYTQTHAQQTKTGVRPTLHLYAAVEDKDKDPAESVSVASWTTESILEFLQDSIPPASAQAKEKAQKEAAAGSAHEEL